MIFLRNKIKNKMKNSTKLSFVVAGSSVYVIVSSIVFFGFLFFIFVPEETVYALLPTCEWKLYYGKECFLCGISHSFCEITKLNFSSAFNLNMLGIPIFFLLMANEIFFIMKIKSILSTIKNNYEVMYNASH